ncbi:hypothetical protein MTR_6g080150 [Medicago truncatula]|uniref:Uncharacterized protein n=1 Tax=Medicago truncatula TaxID=3880 RepID=A0A072UAZ6_MEDTR|nr:hypothetical protein MTR_6g080150 [Medicago truncatula]
MRGFGSATAKAAYTIEAFSSEPKSTSKLSLLGISPDNIQRDRSLEPRQDTELHCMLKLRKQKELNCSFKLR